MNIKAFLKDVIWPLVSTCGVAGLAFTILAPLGTSNISFVPRLGFWFATCFVGGFGASAFSMLAERKCPDLSGWIYVPAQAAMSAVPVYILLYLMGTSAGAYSSALNMVIGFGVVWFVGLIICTFGWFVHTGRQRRDGAVGSQAIKPALYDRLPVHLRSADIYALTSEDHYVRIITSRGDELVLMRLSDAIREAAPLQGLQTHRSWWVAEAGIEEVQKSGAKMSILLKNSAEAAVSRSGAKSVRDAGWV